MKSRFLVIFFIVVAFASKAQTVTDPWATLGASDIQTSFIVMDAANNLYVSNYYNSTISKITPSGTVTQAWATLAGNSRPYGIVIDPSGILYTVNRGAPGPYTISKVTPSSDGSSGTVIQTWATIGDEAYTISMDASGNLYTPFVSTNKIAKIVPAVGGATGTVTKPWVTLATGANPFSISFDASGNLYSANSNNTISKITPAGSVTQAWATLATSSNPQFMVFDPTGNMYVSCWGTSTVSKINSGGTVTDVWSLGTSVWPAGIVLDDLGNIYTANYNSNSVSKITSSGTVTQAYATLATGSYPFYITKDASGNLYITNMGNGTVSKISGPTLFANSSGQRLSIENASTAISAEGGINYGTAKDLYGKKYNTTSLTTTSGTIGSTTAILGGVISATNAVTSSVGVIYSTASNFGTYSTTTIGSNAAAGTYTSTITGLAASTNYYAKSFIVNGAGTSYGDVVSFTTAAPSFVTDGLVLNLDAGNSASYAGTGTTWTDLSSKGNNGTLVNTITHTATNPGYLIFNGNGNAIAQGGRNPYVSLPQSTDFDFGNGDFTLEMWAYTTTDNTHPDFINLNQNAALYAALRIEYWNNSLNVLHSYDGTSHVSGPSVPFTQNLNSWQQIVISRISGTAKLYLNGDLKSTYSLPGSLLAQQETRIGDLRGSLGYYSFSGNISIVKMFKNKGLTDTEVTTHFNLLKSRFGL